MGMESQTAVVNGDGSSSNAGLVVKGMARELEATASVTPVRSKEDERLQEVVHRDTAFTPASKPVSSVVAVVTPFKAGKAPVPAASTVRPAILSTFPTTIAVTPISFVAVVTPFKTGKAPVPAASTVQPAILSTVCVVAVVTPFKAGKAPVLAASTVRPAMLSTVSTTIAVTPISVVAVVTPFKAGKAPVPAASTVRPAILSTVSTTIAVTPIRKTGFPLASGNGYSQMQRGLAPPHLTTSVSIVQPEPYFLECSASGGGGGDKASVLDEKRVTLNPNAIEYIPRKMNLNAAVFVPSRMLGTG